MEEYEKKHDHAVAEKETDIPKLTDLLLKVGTQQFLETLSPYITGGEILFDGEDGQTWKFTFDPENKSWQQKCGTESFTDQMMIHELEQKGYEIRKEGGTVINKKAGKSCSKRKIVQISNASSELIKATIQEKHISYRGLAMEENQMTLINDGTLTIEKGYTEQFLKLLIDQNIIETLKDVEITEENETVDIDLSEVYGNLTDSLEKLCESCKKEGINVDGLIEYYGDYDGKYEIIGTVFHEYSSDEYAVKESVETRDLISPSLKGKLLQMIEEMSEFVIESPEKCTKTMQSMKKLLIDTKDR